MDNIYSDDQYLENNSSWHAESSSWKAVQIYELMRLHSIHASVKSIVEVGCGVGRVLTELSRLSSDSQVLYFGYNISQQAIARTNSQEQPNVQLFQRDLTSLSRDITFDALLAIDFIGTRSRLPKLFVFVPRAI